MQINAKDLSQSEAYHLMTSIIVPRPIAWVGTKGADNSDNIAPFSYFSGLSSEPPLLGIAIAYQGKNADGSPIRKDTANNILDNGLLTVSLVSAPQVMPMLKTASRLPAGRSEFEHAGLKAKRAPEIDVAYPEEATAMMECRLQQVLDLGNTQLFIAEILHFHLADGLSLADPVRFDAERAGIIGRLGGNFCTIPPLKL